MNFGKVTTIRYEDSIFYQIQKEYEKEKAFWDSLFEPIELEEKAC